MVDAYAKGQTRLFVSQWLERCVLEAGARKIFDVESELRIFLGSQGMEETEAAERAAQVLPHAHRIIVEYTQRWHYQGISPPFSHSPEDSGLIISWDHSDFAIPDGVLPPSRGIFEIYNWLGGLRERGFLAACVCYLCSLGCDRIFITDESGDEGIDCIGSIGTGPLQGTTFYVQAKSSPKPCSGDEIRSEFGKYAGLTSTDMHMRYLRALGMDRSSSGSTRIHLLISNADAFHAASEVPSKLGSLFRSRRQVAVTLARSFTLGHLSALAGSVAIPSERDLARNMAPLFPPDIVNAFF